MSFPRYPEYKDSGVEWLGEVPAHWGVLPLFGVAGERYESNAGMVENNLLSLSYGRIVQKDIDSNDGLLPESFETYQVVWPNDIVFRLTDLQNDKRSLRTAIVTQKGIITSAYLAVTPHRTDPKYMHYLLRACDERKVFYSMGGGLRQSMKYSDVKRLSLPVPLADEQRAVAAFLDRETAKIDALVAEQEKLIALLKEKRQAVISHAVTKGLNPDAPMKDSGIEWLGEVPAHWTSTRLRFLFRQAKRQNRQDKQVLSVYRDYGVIPKDSRDDNLNKTPDDLSLYQLVNPGDLVVNKMKAWQGSLGVSELEGITSPDYVVFAPTHGCESEFLHLLLRSQRMVSVYLGISNGIRPAQWRLEPGQFLALEIFLPPEEEQCEVASFVKEQITRLADLAVEAQRGIDLLLERRSALISAAVTGKIDVRGLAAERQAA